MGRQSDKPGIDNLWGVGYNFPVRVLVPAGSCLDRAGNREFGVGLFSTKPGTVLAAVIGFVRCLSLISH
jgi:hypothetical protein